MAAAYAVGDWSKVFNEAAQFGELKTTIIKPGLVSFRIIPKERYVIILFGTRGYACAVLLAADNLVIIKDLVV